MIYSTPSIHESLTQGDILDGCPIFGFEVGSEPVDMNSAPSRWSEQVIVLTQACDLANAKTTRVLVALVHSCQLLVDQGLLKATVIRDQVRRGQTYGWYFLPKAELPVKLAESVIDLHDLHTVPRAVLEQLIQNGKRVGRLTSPYREHLAQHFAVTYMRIGLPIPFETES